MQTTQPHVHKDTVTHQMLTEVYTEPGEPTHLCLTTTSPGQPPIGSYMPQFPPSRKESSGAPLPSQLLGRPRTLSCRPFGSGEGVGDVRPQDRACFQQGRNLAKVPSWQGLSQQKSQFPPQGQQREGRLKMSIFPHGGK